MAKWPDRTEHFTDVPTDSRPRSFLLLLPLPPHPGSGCQRGKVRSGKDGRSLAEMAVAKQGGLIQQGGWEKPRISPGLWREEIHEKSLESKYEFLLGKHKRDIKRRETTKEPIEENQRGVPARWAL